MAVTRCIGMAVKIGGLPVTRWADETEKLPEACPHEDCTGARNCRALVEGYLRVQWEAMRNKARIEAEIKAGTRKSEITRRPGR